MERGIIPQMADHVLTWPNIQVVRLNLVHESMSPSYPSCTLESSRNITQGKLTSNLPLFVFSHRSLTLNVDCILYPITETGISMATGFQNPWAKAHQLQEELGGLHGDPLHADVSRAA